MAEAKRLEDYERQAATMPTVPKATTPRSRLAVLLVVAGLGGLSLLASGPQAKSGLLQATGTPSAAPNEALRQLRATEDAALTTYGWVDRKNGIVHIPIDRAMDLILQRGLPTRPPEQPGTVF